MKIFRDFEILEKSFYISGNSMRRIISDFHSEMRKGLEGKKSSLKMIPEYVKRPSGREKGVFLAIDLGGTNFRVLRLELKGKRKIGSSSAEKYVIKEKYMVGRGEELFGFIAGCIVSFMKRRGMKDNKKHDMGFTFSFPVRKKSVSSGTLIHWTKGFRASGVEGRDVVSLLNKALERKGLRNTRVVALLNDTVSTLLSKSYENPYCDVGVILGTGTNACYSEKISNIRKINKKNDAASAEMIINIEWGNFNRVPITKYDEELDRNSINPGDQFLEKMVSGMYLGEIARLIVSDLIKKRVIFRTGEAELFKKIGNFKTEYMSIIESDNSNGLSAIKRLLKKHGINSAAAERKILRSLCKMVSERAARISGAVMSAVITKMDPVLKKKHSIAIDGSLYEKHPRFAGNMKKALSEIFKNKSRRIKIELAKDGSARGAAILAAV